MNLHTYRRLFGIALRLLTGKSHEITARRHRQATGARRGNDFARHGARQCGCLRIAHSLGHHGQPLHCFWGQRQPHQFGFVANRLYLGWRRWFFWCRLSTG